MRGFPSAKATKLFETFYDAELGVIYNELYCLKTAGDVEGINELAKRCGFVPDFNEEPLKDLVAEIKAGAAELHKEDKTAKLWLKQFSGQPIKAVKLIEAWKSRKLAEQYGIPDNPAEILHFVALKGIQIYADAAIADGRTDITGEEFAHEETLVVALGSRYSPEASFKAVERKIHYNRDRGSYPAKILGKHKDTFEVG